MLIFIILMLLISVIPGILVTFLDFKYYYKIYKTLPYRTYYLNYNHVYSHKFNELDDGFIWFIETRDFKLTKNVYLHNTYFSLYGWWWLKKYQKWFKDNVDLTKIEKY